MTMIDMGMDTAWCLACSKQLVSALKKGYEMIMLTLP